MEFMEEMKSSEVVNGNKIDFLFTMNVVCGLDIFKPSVNLVGPVMSKEGTAHLAVCQHGDLQVLIHQVLMEGQGDC